MTIVNMLDAKSNLSRLVKDVESGVETEIIIARNGRPAARLVAIAARPDVSKRLGLLAGLYPDMSLEAFNETDEEIAALFTDDP